VAWYAFVAPGRSFVVDLPTAVALALYVVVTTTEVTLVHLMRRSLRRMAEAEAEAQAAAHRGMLMFAELQHRVSNNLGVVGSLLALQRRRVTDPTAARALEEAERRVNVVSRLSRLLVDPEAQEVDFGAFLRALVPDVVAAAAAEDRLSVTVAAEPIAVTAASAVPLGLIAAELISNAIEHGFPAGRAGRIDVRLASHGEERALLLIQDDGAGLPDGFDVAHARSLGLTIARQFAGQMGALLSMEGGRGALARLDFPTTA
jgi:two-component sensor histidine kinase